jgi:hypothetical protein
MRMEARSPVSERKGILLRLDPAVHDALAQGRLGAHDGPGYRLSAPRGLEDVDRPGDDQGR